MLVLPTSVFLYRQEHGVVPWQCKYSAVVCAYLGDDICSMWLFACAARSTLAAVLVLHVGFTNCCILVQTRAWCCTSTMQTVLWLCIYGWWYLGNPGLFMITQDEWVLNGSELCWAVTVGSYLAYAAVCFMHISQLCVVHVSICCITASALYNLAVPT